MLVASFAGAALVWWVRPAAVEPAPSRFPSRFPVHGIDVSRHNGAIDWPRVADAGVAFAWIKASEGGDVRDPRFTENVTGASAAGLRVGAYHFFTFCRPAADQARQFLATIQQARLTLPPVVDVEFVGNCRAPPSRDAIRAELEQWIATVEAALGRRVVVYTTNDADEQLLRGLERARWMRSIPGEPSRPWSFWQLDPSGRVPGVVGVVDLDVFQGSLAELDSL